MPPAEWESPMNFRLIRNGSVRDGSVSVYPWCHIPKFLLKILVKEAQWRCDIFHGQEFKND